MDEFPRSYGSDGFVWPFSSGSEPLVCSVVQLAEAGDPAVHPVGLGPVRRQLQGQHVVGGMAGGGQGPSPRAGLVHGTRVDVLMLELGRLPGPEPDDGKRVEQDLREGLSNHHQVPVPASPLHEARVRRPHRLASGQCGSRLGSPGNITFVEHPFFENDGWV